MTQTFAVAVVMAGLAAACGDHAVALRPVFRVGDRLVASDEPIDPRMGESLRHVLRFYGVKFHDGASGAILITKRVADDLPLLWNYTTKASDKAWSLEHPLPDPAVR